MNVQLFIPCFVDQFFPATAFNMIKVLEKVGCKVSYNPNQTCCGQPACNAGYWTESAEVAQKFLADFNNADFDYIVAPSASCVGFVRNYYQKLLIDSNPTNTKLPQKNETQIAKIKTQLFEFTEFLVNILQVDNLNATLEGIATYHDACGALRECGIKKEPRKLLKNVQGLQLQESPDCETCCGFGGTFAVKYEAISVAMAEQKVNNILEHTKAKYIISTDLSCLMHLDAYIKKQNKPLQTMHIADVLAMY